MGRLLRVGKASHDAFATHLHDVDCLCYQRADVIEVDPAHADAAMVSIRDCRLWWRHSKQFHFHWYFRLTGLHLDPGRTGPGSICRPMCLDHR